MIIMGKKTPQNNSQPNKKKPKQILKYGFQLLAGIPYNRVCKYGNNECVTTDIRFIHVHRVVNLLSAFTTSHLQY